MQYKNMVQLAVVFIHKLIDWNDEVSSEWFNVTEITDNFTMSYYEYECTK